MVHVERRRLSPAAALTFVPASRHKLGCGAWLGTRSFLPESLEQPHSRVKREFGSFIVSYSSGVCLLVSAVGFARGSRIDLVGVTQVRVAFDVSSIETRQMRRRNRLASCLWDFTHSIGNPGKAPCTALPVQSLHLERDTCFFLKTNRCSLHTTVFFRPVVGSDYVPSVGKTC